MSKKEENSKNTLKCSFCGKTNEEVNRIIVGPDDICICDECIDTCSKIISDNATQDQDSLDDIPTPDQIAEHLSQYVIEHEEAKKPLRSQFTIIIRELSILKKMIRIVICKMLSFKRAMF